MVHSFSAPSLVVVGEEWIVEMMITAAMAIKVRTNRSVVAVVFTIFYRRVIAPKETNRKYNTHIAHGDGLVQV